MKIFAGYKEDRHPPLLTFYIHDAPHRRSHMKVLLDYRENLVAACNRAGIKTPINDVIDLHAYYINPTSPDYDNLATALSRSVDGKALKGPAVLGDDGQVSHYASWRLYTGSYGD